jgi:predicted ATP-grasp superfamily ATP-dependent carboligase
VQSVKRLLGHVNYRGIFSTEVKRDEATGTCLIIDVNARPWWFVEFAGQCGVDVCSMAVQDALGLPVSPVRQYRAGLRCVYPYYDFSACVELRREKRLSLSGCMKAWLLSTQPEWRWTDPLPAIASTVALGRGWIGHRLHRKPRGRRGA